MTSQKFSLSFSRKIEKKSLQPSAIRSDGPAEVKNSTEVLKTIEENVLQTDGKVEETELVIPMVQTDRAAIFRRLGEKQRGSSTPGSPQQGEVKETEKGTKAEEEGSKPKENGSKVEEDNVKLKEEEGEENKKPMTLDEQAEAALLQESQSRLNQWEQQGGKDSNLSISTLAQDTSLSAPVTDVGKESSLDDYDRIEVGSYGAALLRGMGWKKSEGIGGKSTGRKVVEIIDPTGKTFNLMGSKEEDAKGKEPTEGQKEELMLAKGSYVFLHSGRSKGAYGVVETVDEDHLLVKVAVSQKVVREVEFNVRVVTQQEFKDSSRVINKDMYDKFKEKDAKKNEDSRKSHKDKNSSELSSREKRTHSKESLRSSSKGKNDTENEAAHRAEDREHKQHTSEKNQEAIYKKENKAVNESKWEVNDKKYKQEYKKEKDDKDKQDYKREKDDKYQQEKSKKYDERYHYHSSEKEKIKEKYSSSKYYKSKREAEEDRGSQVSKKQQRVEEQRPVIPWVRECLRVRLISKSYKGGKYHKQKVLVRSVETAESCECVTEEGRVLQEVHPQWLETVIPKNPPQLILIVKGPHKGQLAHILQLHKQEEKASVQMLEDETFILKLHYDDICEYVQR